MVNSVMSAMTGAIVGVIAFVVIKSIVAAQTTTSWTAAEIAIVTVIPVGLGVMVLVSVFKSIS